MGKKELALENQLLKPKRLERGDTIGIVAPGSPVNRSALKRGIQFLQKSGYSVVVHPQCYQVNGFLAGTDLTRAQAINKMFTDNSVQAIFCARGGYGALRLLPFLDYKVIACNPKIFLGYSDITALHLAIWRKTKIATFHGPMVSTEMAKGLPKYTRDSLFSLLCRSKPYGRMSTIGKKRFEIIRTGKSTGLLLGGNLSLICKLIGSSFLPDFSGSILFLEEIDEEPYRIDGMLLQLKLAGILDQVAGVVLGDFVDCGPYDRIKPSFSLREVLHDNFFLSPYPVIRGIPFGHGHYSLTIPYGVRATIDAESKRFYIVESAVS